MSAGDWIVLLVLALILLLIFRSARRTGRRSCSGDCAHCGQVDWEKVRCEIHRDREQKKQHPKDAG